MVPGREWQRLQQSRVLAVAVTTAAAVVVRAFSTAPAAPPLQEARRMRLRLRGPWWVRYTEIRKEKTSMSQLLAVLPPPTPHLSGGSGDAGDTGGGRTQQPRQASAVGDRTGPVSARARGARQGRLRPRVEDPKRMRLRLRGLWWVRYTVNRKEKTSMSQLLAVLPPPTPHLSGGCGDADSGRGDPDLASVSARASAELLKGSW